MNTTASPTHIPSTPTIRRFALSQTYKPLNSSPLASPTTPSKGSFAKRRAAYKSISGGLSLDPQPLFQPRTPKHPTSSPNQNIYTVQRNVEEDPSKQFLRDKIRAKAFARAQKARERAIKKRRYTGYSDRSSDGFECDMDNDMDGDGDTDGEVFGRSGNGRRGGKLCFGTSTGDEDDDEEDDEEIMDDELFRRIMAQTDRKTNHAYRVSYALEVGSSFDPDLEDLAEWEEPAYSSQTQVPSSSSAKSFPLPPEDQEDLSPAELLDEELEAYAEEYARQAVLDEFADIPEEDLFHYSDFDDDLDFGAGNENKTENMQNEMDTS